MRIIALTENTQGNTACRAEHGLSLYIETKEHKILMDTGQSDLLVRNAALLGVSLAEVDTVVISHGHYDHGGGLPAFAGINQNAKIYIRESAFSPCYSLGPECQPRYIGLDPSIRTLPGLVMVPEDQAEPVFHIDGELALFSDIGLLHPQPSANFRLRRKEGERLVQDDFRHEQCLVIRQGAERFLFSGCAHHGILNILDRYRQLFHGEPAALFSGFHMMKKDGYSQEDIRQIQDTARALLKTGTACYTCHCTGTEPYEIMKKEMGERLSYIHCGDEILLPAPAQTP